MLFQITVFITIEFIAMYKITTKELMQIKNVLDDFLKLESCVKGIGMLNAVQIKGRFITQNKTLEKAKKLSKKLKAEYSL